MKARRATYAHDSSACPTTFDVTKIARIVADNRLKKRFNFPAVGMVQHSRHASDASARGSHRQLRTKLSTVPGGNLYWNADERGSCWKIFMLSIKFAVSMRHDRRAAS
jgi:hypothetical protein